MSTPMVKGCSVKLIEPNRYEVHRTGHRQQRVNFSSFKCDDVVEFVLRDGGTEVTLLGGDLETLCICLEENFGRGLNVEGIKNLRIVGSNTNETLKFHDVSSVEEIELRSMTAEFVLDSAKRFEGLLKLNNANAKDVYPRDIEAKGRCEIFGNAQDSLSLKRSEEGIQQTVVTASVSCKKIDLAQDTVVVLDTACCNVVVGGGNSKVRLAGKNTKVRKIEGRDVKPLKVEMNAGSTLLLEGDASNIAFYGNGGTFHLYSGAARQLFFHGVTRLKAEPNTAVVGVKGKPMIEQFKKAQLSSQKPFEISIAETSNDVFQDATVSGFVADLRPEALNVLLELQKASIVNPVLRKDYDANPEQIQTSLELLDRICQAKSSSGTARSEVAYANAKLRIRTTKYRTEKLLLWLYGWLGFSQKIRFPLGVWLLVIVISLLLAACFDKSVVFSGTQIHWCWIGKTVMALVAEPLNLLQVRNLSKNPALPWEETAIMIQRVALVVPFASLVVAIRRRCRVSIK